eukprot:c24559_g1_i1 orf=259-2940(-)
MACVWRWSMWVLFLAAMRACLWDHVAAQLDAGDMSVLSDFKAKVKNGDQLGWKNGQNPCSWKGIKCTGSFISSISLANLGLGGSITPNLNKLAFLTSISLQRNGFTGALPSLSGLSSLQACYLNDNQFNTIPSDFFRNLTSLRYLYIHNNLQLNATSLGGGWSLTTDLQASLLLTNLSLTNTSLVGEIPAFLGNMGSLSILNLAYNKLGGSIPSSFGASSLQQFQANNQLGPRLSGDLRDVGNMLSLTQLWLHENELSGVLPSNLSKAISLTDLRLNDNNLVGPIPESYRTLPLSVFAVENNQLDGPLPVISGQFTYSNNLFCQNTTGVACAPQVTTLLEFLGSVNYLPRLVSSWSGNNPCGSWVGIICDSKGNVVVINLASTNLSGVINPSIAQLAFLTTLKLNNNNLVGTVPSTLVGLPLLRTLDVSNNNITGPLPTFAHSVAINTAGNPFINVTIPSSSNGTSSSSKTKGKSRLSNVIPIVVSFLLIAIAAVLAVGYFMHKRKDVDAKSLGKLPISPPDSVRSMDAMQGSSHKALGGLEHRSFALSMRTLQVATNDFSEDFFLGRGGFGSVYKGCLEDGTVIAVKKMDSTMMTNQGQREFQSEVDVLTKLRHRHLVAILGYCIEGDEKALVYEYMPGGTLSQHLFAWSRYGMTPLSWKSRLSIALDVARGLEYLHGLAQSRFIHRDLKPSNILLDESLRAKISDFGLVRLVPEGEKQSVQTLVAGTFGYLAPEYAYTGHITTKGDVFSFGVVLMELITGRPALDNTQTDGNNHLMTWFRRIIGKKDELLKAVDPNIVAGDDDTVLSICVVAELAGHCTNKEALQRPDMGHAVNVLAPLVKAWKPMDNVEHGSEAYMTPEEVRKKLLSLNDYTMTMDMMTHTKTIASSKPV